MIRLINALTCSIPQSNLVGAIFVSGSALAVVSVFNYDWATFLFFVSSS